MANHFHYIQFPFGLLDYNCLVEIRHFYEMRAIASLEQEEKAWFEQLLRKPYHWTVVNIKTFFQERVWGKSLGKTGKLLRNLVGKRWVTDQEISTVFNMLNKQYPHVFCFTSVPFELLNSCTEVKEKIE